MCNGKRHPLKKRKDRQLEQIKSWKERTALMSSWPLVVTAIHQQPVTERVLD